MKITSRNTIVNSSGKMIIVVGLDDGSFWNYDCLDKTWEFVEPTTKELEESLTELLGRLK